jgi:hypothetical protein
MARKRKAAAPVPPLDVGDSTGLAEVFPAPLGVAGPTPPASGDRSAGGEGLGTASPPDTTADLERLKRFEAQMEQGFRSYVEGLRVVLTERLYRAMGYHSVEDYMQGRWAKTRRWAYDQLMWLSTVQFLESKNVTNPLQNLSVDAAQVFRQWQNRPEIFYLAYRRVVETGDEPTKDRLEREAEVQQAYLLEADSIPELTFAEYEAYQRLDSLPSDYSLEATTAAELIRKSRERVHKPYLSQLAAVARGEELVKVVDALAPLSAEVAKVHDLKKKKDTLQKQKREQTQALTEQIREVTAELDKLTGGGEPEGEPGDEADSGEDTTPESPAAAPVDIGRLMVDLGQAISDLRARTDAERAEVVRGLDERLVDDLAKRVHWLRREKKAVR